MDLEDWDVMMVFDTRKQGNPTLKLLRERTSLLQAARARTFSDRLYGQIPLGWREITTPAFERLQTPSSHMVLSIFERL